MSTITVRKTKKAENLIVENQVAVAGTSLDAQLDVVEAASKVTVITGSTKPAAEVTASNATIAGRAGNATVKQVAAGINSVVNSNNTITLSHRVPGTVSLFGRRKIHLRAMHPCRRGGTTFPLLNSKTGKF